MLDLRMKPTLILHIGYPKTGSTSLQHFMADNRSALLAQGVPYSKALDWKSDALAPVPPNSQDLAQRPVASIPRSRSSTWASLWARLDDLWQLS